MKKRVFSILGLIIVFSMMLTSVSKIVKYKYSDEKYRIFYDNPTDFDVLFFGASVVHYSEYPMQLWHDYGITSYNMGNDSERLSMTYYNILNALDYANPKLIVVDLASVGWAGTNRDNTIKDHYYLDAVPLSKNKLKEIHEIFEGAEQLEYIFPFILYHSRWDELKADDFRNDKRDIKYGAIRTSDSSPFPSPSPDNYNESRVSDVYLETDNIARIIDLCESRGVEVIFTYLPTALRGGDQINREALAEIMKGFDVDYYDLLQAGIVDWNCDSFDGMHLNYYGGRKLTNCIGTLLNYKYQIPDRRDDSSLNERWNQDYLEYEQSTTEFIMNTQESYVQAGGTPISE